MLRDQEKYEELYLVGLLQYLARHYGHRLQTALFGPLLDSVVEQAEEFGNPGIDDSRAMHLRRALEAAILARHERAVA